MVNSNLMQTCSID